MEQNSEESSDGLKRLIGSTQFWLAVGSAIAGAIIGLAGWGLYLHIQLKDAKVQVADAKVQVAEAQTEVSKAHSEAARVRIEAAEIKEDVANAWAQINRTRIELDNLRQQVERREANIDGQLESQKEEFQRLLRVERAINAGTLEKQRQQIAAMLRDVFQEKDTAAGEQLTRESCLPTALEGLPETVRARIERECVKKFGSQILKPPP